jgi:hypothetical protein
MTATQKEAAEEKRTDAVKKFYGVSVYKTRRSS